MNQLHLQMGGGVYARIEPSIDGFITVTFGEIMSGMFFPVSDAQTIHVALWDGNAWHPDIFWLAQELRKGQPNQSTLLQAALKKVALDSWERMKELRREPYRTGDQEIELARCIQTCARAGYLSNEILRHWSRSRLSPVVRAVVVNELTTRAARVG